MTPRRRAIEALERRRPPGRVPSCELAFALHSEWLGRPINWPHGPLQMNRFEEVEAAARYCLEYGGVEQGGYIYSTSNAVFGGEINGVDVNTYRFVLEVRDRYMSEQKANSQ
jgi:hypothetical protein